MPKPYIKTFGKVSQFLVKLVDGMYIRSNMDEEFTNFGQHYRFSFIPKNEFWIDHKFDHPEEIHYYIDHLLVEYRLMERGMEYDRALAKADRVEKSERLKSVLLRRIKSNEVIDQVHKTLLKSYSRKIKVWVVDGELVRDLFFIDFTEGGHDHVYHFVPKNEIWIDSDVNPKERKFVLLHELHERNLMAQRLKVAHTGRLNRHKIYSWAHRSASELEYLYRHNPQGLDKAIQQELKKS
ncbi:MAG: hypothetical protein QT02_C0001G0020 [archaeon GW2011_AR9]|nr:MAG: hypothetical protein QT02_C0001G0020 [archaeon GW2011_AR9]MBS3120207.1 hypothetical protein [Candidatus Woesearchaeota archaeon]HIG93436.1 hypothetical protein [Candidatus Woesearchaeota archaeon]HIH12637.1 hypothetical protein [Candidatus Woesearchaeota archaeon]